MYRIDLLRHGTTELSHTLRGSTDDALTAEGWQQMALTLDQSLAAQMRWDAVFSSPLQRCHAFAAQAAAQLELPLIPAPWMQEMRFGDWEAVSAQQIYETEPEALQKFWLQPTQFTPPNAESLQAFEQRILSGLEQLLQHMRQRGYKRALLVTHGGVIKLLKCKALRQPLDDVLKMTAELGQLNSFELADADSIRILEQEA